MIKILMVTSQLTNGGITNLIKTWIRFINKDEFAIDIAVYNKSNENLLYFEEHNCEIYYIESPRKNYKKFKKELTDLLRTNQYQVIHAHTQLNSGFIMKVAHRVGIPMRISHSHASKDYKKGRIFSLYKMILINKIKKHSTHLFACSELAGNYLFGDSKFEIFENSINSGDFSYVEAFNRKLRKRYNVSYDEIIYGTMGMMWEVKNQKYLIEIMKFLLKKEKKCKLFLVGDGILRSQMQRMVEEYGLSDSVIFTGWVSNTTEFYSLFDVFLLPSISEGFPLALLEAQSAGCKCVVSSNITKSVQLSSDLYFLPIGGNDVSLWVDLLDRLILGDSRNNCVIDTEYDVKLNLQKLEQMYMRFGN